MEYDVINAMASVNAFRAHVLVEADKNGGLLFQQWLVMMAKLMRLDGPPRREEISALEWNAVMTTLVEAFGDFPDIVPQADAENMLDAVEQAFTTPSDDDDEAKILALDLSPAQVAALASDLIRAMEGRSNA